MAAMLVVRILVVPAVRALRDPLDPFRVDMEVKVQLLQKEKSLILM